MKLFPKRSQAWFTKLIIILLAGFAAIPNLKSCDVINGSDIIYTWISGKKYAIKYVLYHQCVCKLSVLPTFTAKMGNNTTTTKAKRISIRDITNTCTAEFPPCQTDGTSSGSRLGIEEHIFVDTIDFDKTPYSTWIGNGECKVHLRVAQPWGLVSTTTSTSTYGGECEIDLCKIGKQGNNSPRYTNIPMTFMCCNNPFYFNNGAVDVLDGDSLSFDLDDPLQSSFTPVSWLNPWTKRIPLTPFCPSSGGKINCTPNPSAKPPRGFYFDSLLGDIVLTPTKCTESGPISIRVTEWRLDSNKKWQQLGFVRRDIFVNVLDCGYNNPPTITAKQSHFVCEGDQICFKIKSNDEAFVPHQAKGDTTTLTWSNTIPGATFKIVDSTVREREAEFCWKTKVGNARKNPYTFTATAKDDFCPNPGICIKGFKITVNPRAFDSRQYDILKCGRLAFQAKEALGFEGKPSYKWSIRDSNKLEFKISTKQKDTITMPHGGRFYVVHTINNSFNCPTSYIDTVDFPWPPKVELATKDTHACYGTTSVLVPRIFNAKSPYKYYWSRPAVHFDADTNSTLEIPGFNRDSTITVRITDGDGCVFYDTAIVYVKPLPIVNLGPDKRICTYETASFDAQNADTVWYAWNSGDTTREITKHVDGNYIVTITDTTWKCKQKDTVYLHVNDTAISLAGSDMAICTRLEANLFASHKPSAETATYQWTNLTSNVNLGTNKNIKVKPTNSNGDGNPAVTYQYELYTKVTQGGHTCEDRDTMVVKVNTLPKVVMPTLVARCYDYGDVEFQNLSGITPVKSLRNSLNFKITGKRISTSITNKLNSSTVTELSGTDRFIFRTSNIDNEKLQGSTNYSERIYLSFSDTNGCQQVDSSKIQVINGNPIIEFLPANYCQDLGEFDIDRAIKRPKPVASIVNWTINTLSKTGNTVDLSSRIVDKNGGFSSPDDWFTFGNPSEDFYQGLYTVEYCVQNKLTTCRNCDTMSINIKGEPVITTTQPPRICVSDTAVNMLQFFKVDGVAAELHAGDTLFVSNYVNGNLTNPQLKLTNTTYFDPKNQPGSWRFKYRTSSSGCVKFDSVDMEINDLPRFSITPIKFVCSDAPAFDLNKELIIPSSIPVGASVSWTGPSGFLTGSTISPKRDGTGVVSPQYPVVGAYTDDKGCKRKDTLIFSVRNAPTVNISSAKPSNACEGTALNITSTSNWTNDILWTKENGSDGAINNSSALNISYLNGTNDAAVQKAWLKISTLAITPVEVCAQAEDSIVLNIHPYPIVAITKSYKKCVPITADFTSVESKGITTLTYDWNFGNGNTSAVQNPTGIAYLNQGKFDVKLSVTNTAGNCATVVDSLGYVEAYPIPVADFITDPIKTTIALPKIKTINKSVLDKSTFTGGTMNYLWDFGTGNPADVSTEFEPAFSYGKDTATYLVKLIVSSDKGCLDTVVRKVIIGPDIIVFIPDAFTPDGVGADRNNTFKVSVLNEKAFNLKIYNRWGEKMFETKDKNQGWNGQFRGTVCADGVYVYALDVISDEDKTYSFRGTITLLK